MKNKEQTIVCFHIGRGGQFHNQGHKSFIGDNTIDNFTDKLFLNYENESKFKNRVGWDESHEGVKCILDCFTDRDTDTLEESYGITEEQLGEYIYTDGNGNPVGLTHEQGETGVGKIDIDGAYDTTYCCLVEDCDQEELQLIINYGYDFTQSYMIAKSRLIEEFGVEFESEKETEDEA